MSRLRREPGKIQNAHPALRGRRYGERSNFRVKGWLAQPGGFGYSDCYPMATPCKKCGAEKTETVHHGLLYGLARAFGYRLRMCSRCHRLRLIPRQSKRPSGNSTEQPASPREVKGACPSCGKVDYRRSRRHFWEHVLLRGPMVRCRGCRTRFRMPRPVDLAN